MNFKLIIALIEDTKTDKIMSAARKAGATGATIVSDARGEGLKPQPTFFGLNLETHRNMLMFIVEEHLSRHILETISDIGGFEKTPGSGIAFQINIEDAVGLESQILAIKESMKKKLSHHQAKARNKPSALCSVSTRSFSCSESATIPAPAAQCS